MSYTDAIIDVSHHNGRIDLVRASHNGVIGVIQKASQGLNDVDPTYAHNLKQANDAGLLWGAYHFGTGTDGVAQAEHFLNVVQPSPDTLLVLDFEGNPQGASMSIDEARAFLMHVQARTGRWPGIYGGYYLKQVLGALADPVFQKCWFWLSQYGPTAVVPPIWNSWTLWQYTDGALGVKPAAVPGVGLCDRNYYCSTADELCMKWKSGTLASD